MRNLNIGSFLEIEGVPYQITEALPENRFVIRNYINSEKRTVTLNEILTGYTDKTIRVGLSATEIDKNLTQPATLSDLLTDDERHFVKQWKLLLTQVVKTNCKRTGEALGKLVLKLVEKGAEGEKLSIHPCPSTIRSHYRIWDLAGRTNYSLIQLVKRKKHRPTVLASKFPAEVGLLYNQVLSDFYMVREKCSVRQLHKELAKAIDARNLQLPWKAGLPTPSLNGSKPRLRR